MFTRAFWIATAERVIASVAGGILAVMAADGFDLLAADWQGVLAAGGLAGAVSLLKAIVAANVGSNPGPSLANERIPGRHAQILPADEA